MSKIPHHQLGPLDEIRGLAALAVFVIHYIQLYYKTAQLGWIGTVADLLGVWGVSIFFVLSGFLIHTGALREFSSTKKIIWRKYFTKRFFRIYPPYFICLIASFGIGWFYQTNMITKASFGNLLTHVILISTYFAHYFESLNAIFWTVIVEVHFYILYPIVWWMLRKQSVWFVFGITLCIGLIYFFIASKYTDVGMERIMQQHTTLVLFWKWVLGVVLAEIYWNKKPSFIIKMLNIRGIIFPLIVLAFVPEIFLSDNLGLQYERFIMPFISFMTIGALLSDNMRLTGNTALTWLGKVSYSLYLWHPIILLFISMIFINSNILSFLCAILFSLAIAWLGHKYIENPSVKLSKSFV